MTTDRNLKVDTNLDSTKVEISDPNSNSPDPESKAESNPDGDWGWIVLLAALFMRIVMTGVYVSFALYTKDFVYEFKISPSVMGWMISIYSAIYLLVSPFASLMGIRFGYRSISIISLIISGLIYPSTFFYPTLWYTFLTASFIVPFFQGICNLCGCVIVASYFDKKLPIAMGIYSCSSGIASFVVPPVMSIIIDKFGWKLSKVIYSTLYILATLSALTFRPVTSPGSKKKDKRTEHDSEENIPFDLQSKRAGNYDISNSKLEGDKEPSDKITVSIVDIHASALIGISVESNLQTKARSPTFQRQKSKHLNEDLYGYIKILKNHIFVLLLISSLLSNLGYDTPYIYTKAKALEMGISETKATLLLSCLGVGNVIGRVGFGYLGSFERINTYLLNIFCLMLAGAFVVFTRFAFTYPLLVACSVGFALFIGGYVTLAQVLLIHILKPADFTYGLSSLYVIQGIGLFAGAPISGLLYDITHSFSWSFLSCGMIIFLSGFILFFAFCSKTFRRQQRFF